ncbi:hypothetical protein B5V89_15515 [Heyndrickxia sporothermodurans]|nr:hypothetical protein B5V89_15515 [Heyndrickxia sporothermodurans]
MTMEIREAVKTRIENLCKERDWTLNELIKRSGVHQPTISEFMNGRSKYPQINTIKKLSLGFGITLSEFFNDDIFNEVDE